jgi:hypothetical protein
VPRQRWVRSTARKRLLECGPRSRRSAFNNLAAALEGFLGDVLQLPPHTGPEGVQGVVQSADDVGATVLKTLVRQVVHA